MGGCEESPQTRCRRSFGFDLGCPWCPSRTVRTNRTIDPGAAPPSEDLRKTRSHQATPPAVHRSKPVEPAQPYNASCAASARRCTSSEACQHAGRSSPPWLPEPRPRRLEKAARLLGRLCEKSKPARGFGCGVADQRRWSSPPSSPKSRSATALLPEGDILRRRCTGCFPGGTSGNALECRSCCERMEKAASLSCCKNQAVRTFWAGSSFWTSYRLLDPCVPLK